MTVDDLKKWIHAAKSRIQENKSYLSDLDQAIGDGDHGTNLARGFEAAWTAIADKNYDDCGALLRDVGMALISKVGGASGPLYGTAFMKMALAAKEKGELTIRDWGCLMHEAAAGIQMRGKAEAGDKTMLDVWAPAGQYFNEHGEDFSWSNWKAFCQSRMAATKGMKAKKGRASYLGSRSIGHLDPGSVSSYYLLSALAECGEDA
ncbi:dihydroxyacetone kinase subunit DhaL [Camelliibacillus cellulosilyticus]|uniref:Dihydroxyacetone kinase subunit DhaL n=1 Tax=Camelliibacillus cellulosilyticus TaxID=2174486 RepID=A0ABV9GN92_9BACL